MDEFAGEGDDNATPWTDPLFLKAFDDTPNKYSPEALELFIASKCVNEGCKISTAESICAAFRKLWERNRAFTYVCSLSFD